MLIQQNHEWFVSYEDHPKSNWVVGCNGLSTHFLKVNLSFEICMQFFKLCVGYNFVKNIFHTFKFFNLHWFFSNKLIKLSLKVFKHIFKYIHIYISRCNVNTIPKKTNYKNIILMITIFRGLNVLSPWTTIVMYLTILIHIDYYIFLINKKLHMCFIWLNSNDIIVKSNMAKYMWDIQWHGLCEQLKIVIYILMWNMIKK